MERLTNGGYVINILLWLEQCDVGESTDGENLTFLVNFELIIKYGIITHHLESALLQCELEIRIYIFNFRQFDLGKLA